MPDVLVRNVPKKVLEGLKRRARRHGRSLQQELKLLFAEVSEESAFDFAERARLVRERIARYAPVQTDSAELIREDRRR
jgi:plasmid stability protein